MLVCGIKASHDGGIALVEDGTLLASIEIEKLGNGLRYSSLGRLDAVTATLRGAGYDPAAVDQFVIDGWETEPGSASATVDLRSDEGPIKLPVAPYVDDARAAPLTRYEFGAVNFGAGLARSYSSYHHASGHILGSYCTSPFAARGEDAMIVVWDGGMLPRAYHVSTRDRPAVRALAPLLPLHGSLFADFCSHFGPFQRVLPGLASDDNMRRHLEIAGKAMAYAALGQVTDESCERFGDLLADLPGISADHAFLLAEKVLANRDQIFPDCSDADIIANVQEYLGRQLCDSISRLVRRRFKGDPINLCLGGGCALNIKWNSKLRDSGLFSDIWVPPFPNDSGAAIGAACCEMFNQDNRLELNWDVFSGPTLEPSALPSGWTAQACDERRLAAILHQAGEPVVVLSGRAELGPRALGNRSIIAPAVDSRMKNLLNDIKGRENYRPVAPVCLASRAAEVFDPGTPDPYMLFEHQTRPAWIDRVPAIVHLDGSARLQTVDESTASPIVAILVEYERLSGIPILCNTSANLNGRGFFPDARTAAEWGRTRRVWVDGTLYLNTAFDGPTLG